MSILLSKSQYRVSIFYVLYVTISICSYNSYIFYIIFIHTRFTISPFSSFVSS
ncbi:hypothetical protein HMPREF3033_01678 [Veillonellaceae bacterium DNF00751]|nr:hypothetical protein HMPREF3033_01678 [Veillonellaceae bacterium DNF00751]